MSEFEALRADLAALRTVRTDTEQRLTHLESQIDQKPNVTTMFLTMLIAVALTIVIVVIGAALMVYLASSFEWQGA